MNKEARLATDNYNRLVEFMDTKDKYSKVD